LVARIATSDAFPLSPRVSQATSPFSADNALALLDNNDRVVVGGEILANLGPEFRFVRCPLLA
jgi:hypothetical protein